MSLNNKSDNIKIRKGLYIVSTPIGNLSDISERSIKTLYQSDYILCEDTRVSKHLLKKFNINSKLISYHKFNEKKNLNKIINLLKSGCLISLISDAGTPTISDPGRILINECQKNDILKLSVALYIWLTGPVGPKFDINNGYCNKRCQEMVRRTMGP